jgi:hypothetical protein
MNDRWVQFVKWLYRTPKAMNYFFVRSNLSAMHWISPDGVYEVDTRALPGLDYAFETGVRDGSNQYEVAERYMNLEEAQLGHKHWISKAKKGGKFVDEVWVPFKPLELEPGEQSENNS